MPSRSPLIETSSLVVRITIVLNRIFFFACVVGLIASFIFPGYFALWIAQTKPVAMVPSVMAGMRELIVIGITMAIATDRLLVTLTDMIATVRAGDPFIPANAYRLRTIGWYLVVLQLSNIPAALLGKVYPAMGNTAPAFDLSISGWIAILMVFVLSRVFAAGSAMREDLQGTV